MSSKSTKSPTTGGLMTTAATDQAVAPTEATIKAAPNLDDLTNVGGLNVTQAARYIGIGETLLWEATNRNEIPHFRVGTRTVYPRHVLDQWMAEQALKQMAKSKRARS